MTKSIVNVSLEALTRNCEWIRWEDAAGGSGWNLASDYASRGTGIVDTVGFVLAEHDDRVILVSGVATLDGDVHADHHTVIPKRCIIQRWTIR